MIWKKREESNIIFRKRGKRGKDEEKPIEKEERKKQYFVLGWGWGCGWIGSSQGKSKLSFINCCLRIPFLVDFVKLEIAIFIFVCFQQQDDILKRYDRRVW